MRPLSPEAVELVLAVLEAEQPMLNGAAAELSPGPVALLRTAGLLVPHGHEQVSASLADDDDSPVSLIPTGEAGGLAYFSAHSGLTTVPKHRVQRDRVEMTAFLSAISIQFDLPRQAVPKVLIESVLWELGAARLSPQRARVTVWFARRLWDPFVRQQVAAALSARPHAHTKIILCSSEARRVATVVLPGVAVMPLRDVLVDDATLATSVEIMDARLRGIAVMPSAGPLDLSPDNSLLRVRGGEPISFRGENQQAAIRLLVDAFYAGKPVPLRDLTDLGSLQRLFKGKKWKLLSPFLEGQGGLWRFDP